MSVHFVVLFICSRLGRHNKYWERVKMKLSDVKEVWAIVEGNLLFQNWTTKQNVNDFLKFLESHEDVIKKGWTRTSRRAFPFCLYELHIEYMGLEGFLEEEEGEREPFMFIDENKYLNDWYYKNVL